MASLKTDAARALEELQRQMAAELQGVVPGVVDVPALASAVVAAGPDHDKSSSTKKGDAPSSASGPAVTDVRIATASRRVLRRPRSEYRPTGEHSPLLGRSTSARQSRQSNLHMVRTRPYITVRVCAVDSIQPTIVYSIFYSTNHRLLHMFCVFQF